MDAALPEEEEFKIIAEFGLRIADLNPKSKIRNPKSKIK